VGLNHRIFQVGGPAWVFLGWLLCSGFLVGGKDAVAVPGATDTSPYLSDLLSQGFPERPRGEAVALEAAIDPEGYVLGPGDELAIVVWGDWEASFAVVVNPDGTVVIPTVGSVDVSGLSLADATDTIIDIVREPYRANRVTVSLSRVRRFLVAVGGAVKVPGTVEVHGGQRVDAAIRNAGGFLHALESPYDTTRVIAAAPRLIQVKRSDGEVVPVDLLLYLKSGNREANAFLQDGDAVEVPFRTTLGSRIGVFGAFRAPGVYDYLPTDRLSVVVQLAGGLASACDVDRATLVRFRDDSTWTECAVDLAVAVEHPGGEADLALEPGDRLFVPWKPNWRLLYQVDVEGQVRHPGSYPIVPGRTTLSEVIAKSGGILPDAALDRARLYRTMVEKPPDFELDRLEMLTMPEINHVEREYRKFSKRNLLPLAVVDFEALFADGNLGADVLMMDGDVVRIPKREPVVHVMGQVMYPGYIAWHSGLTYRDYITVAGGFAERADRGRIRLITGQADSWTKPDDDTEIRDGDTILVPEKTLHEQQRTWQYIIEAVAILSQVATLVLVIQNISE
jgi:polysaccharide export outer membrane protein